MEKMGQWKYSPNQLASQIPSLLLEKIRPRWEFSKQTIKDIYAQTLKQLLPSISDAEVNKSLNKNENKMTVKFNSCLILMKDIEYVVRNATNNWRNFYHLHKPSEYPIEIKDDEDDDYEKDDEESTQFVTVDYEEFKEQEAIEEDKKDDEETDPVKIVAAIIASLPHSLSKPMTT